MMWNVNGGNAYGDSVYALPWAFKADANGMMMAKPVTNFVQSSAGTGTWMMSFPEDGSMTEFVVKPGYSTSGVKVDKVTDWSYEVVMQNAGDESQYMRTTMVQGSPFAYFEMKGTNTATISRKRALDSSVVAYNGSSQENSTMLVVRVYDNHDQTRTGNQYDYYAFYVPEGTTWKIETSDTSHITNMTAVFPADQAYFSVAVLAEKPETEDEAARKIAETYLPYAYNFVTDTRAEYSYNENTQKLTTTYTYTVDKKAGSTADGTVMGVIPHQYKNMSGYTYLEPTLGTMRGTMKFLTGSSFATELTFTGVLPWLTGVEDTAQLGKYVDDYMDYYFSGERDPFEVMYQGTDTYGTGKGLNRTGNVIAAAEAAGKTDDADKLLKALEEELEDWFTASGGDDEKYFYYEDDIGSLYGFPQSYSSVDQTNDHHFHYGYFIYAAAQVALRDPEWASDSNWGLMVKELINDIACPKRNSKDSRYPYLRNFAPYEGHSWASGHSNFSDGNNHESSSEAMNAWAGMILFGEATGDKEIRDLGIYLYTTEISAINNYWFDVDEDVLSDGYRYYGQENVTDESLPTYNQAAQVWGGKMDYATWWTAEPLQIQGINLLPINPASYYLAGDKDYILENWKIALQREAAFTGSDKLGSSYEEYTRRWNDIWSEYIALADPDQAIAYWQPEATEEGGDSKAHTYQYIYSLKEHGTPDTSITSDAAMSAVFDKDGIKTYAVYNAGDAAKEVTFSNGIKVTAAPHKMTAVKETQIEGVCTYKIEYYKENLSGGYTVETAERTGMANSKAVVEPPKIDGFAFDEKNEGNVLEGMVKEDNSLVLKLYYTRESYTIQYEWNDGVEVGSNPASYKYGESFVLNEPMRAGYVFEGWYTEPEFSNQITAIMPAIHGNLKLYAKWKNPNEYEMEPGKKVVYENGDLVFTASGIEGISEALAFFKIVETRQEAEAIADIGVLGGAHIMQDDGSNTWTYRESAAGKEGQFVAIYMNLIVHGAGSEPKIYIYEIPDSSASASAYYYTEYYQEQLDGSYKVAAKSGKYADLQTPVTAEEKDYPGFTLDKSHPDTLDQGTVGENGSLTLRLYYTRNSYTITYELNGGENDAANPTKYKFGEYADGIALKAPTQDGYVFDGWYENENFTGTRVSVIASDSARDYKLYAKWTKQTTGPNQGGNSGNESNTENGTPGGEPNTENGTPGGEPNTESGTPGGEPNTESGTPGGEPNTENGTPGGEPNTENGTPGGEPNTENGTPGGEPNTESGTPGGEPSTENGTPGGNQNNSENQGETQNNPASAKRANPLESALSTMTKTAGTKAFNLNTGAIGRVVYTSSNKGVAIVNSAGKVTLKGAGKTVITVIAAGNDIYREATKMIALTVKPARVRLTSVKSVRAGTITVKWKKDKSKATGYQLQCSLKRNFKGAKKQTIKKIKTVKTTLKKLKGGKKYFVRIRAYKKDGTTITGAWSKPKRVTVKR